MDHLSQESDKSFNPPRHWIGPEELKESFWKDPVVQEKSGQEFFEKPIEFIDNLDKSAKGGIARREFLTIMGASMALSSVACARRPVHKIIPYVVKPEEIIPGVANYYASTYADDAGYTYGILIKNREGRPIKLEGNPDHPVNVGRLSAQAQASLLGLYDPERLTDPATRKPGSSAAQATTWKDADQAILGELSKIAAGNGRVRVLTGAVHSPSGARVIREFLGAFKAGEHVEYEALANDEIAEAGAASYGTAVVPHYRFDQADVVVSLGADFLGTWISPVEYAAAWAKKRKLDSKNHANATMSKLYSFESTFSVTGSNADERYPIRSGDELKIAGAIAHELATKHGIGSASGALSGYTASAVAAEIGIEGLEKGIAEAAASLAGAKGKSLVVAGGLQAKTQDAVALQIVVNHLNSALGNDGATVDGTLNAQPARGGYAAVAKLTKEMAAGQVDALIVHRANPVFTLGAEAKAFADAMAKVPLVIVVPERDNETAIYAHYVLPDHHYLENWGDAAPRKGLWSLQQPSIAPLHNSRAFQDSLITWTHTLKPASMAGKAKDWHEFIRENWKEIFGSVGFETFWENSLQKGLVDKGEKSATSPSARSFRSGALAAVKGYEKGAPGFRLALYANGTIGDGRHANNAWLQELPDPITSVTWDNFVAMAPATAEKMSVSDDDVVEVSVDGVSAKLPVHVQVGMHPDSIAVAVGYGRKVEGKVGKDAGVDVYPFVKAAGDKLVYSGQIVSVRKTGAFYRLARTQWHTRVRARPEDADRPIINDITLAAFRKDPAAQMHTDPELRAEELPSLWGDRHKYPGHRWGMAIDLTSCIGCGACTVACQAENNIPVVGRDGVRVSRQMHWIRVDRYYTGPAENPGVVFQPMLCQHCENAPCETVCPVVATTHDSEGLNVQTYNRCVGTRYCQNNCPYKVRRFNFFDHWKAYEGTMNLVWNPDVTVRTRGIMEKCTFCVQRIREAKDIAKTQGRKLMDGEIKAACQQTCPTDAISFGDVNDPESRVSKFGEDKRAFRVLETLNTRPMVNYMTKVRNKAGPIGESEHAHEGSHA